MAAKNAQIANVAQPASGAHIQHSTTLKIPQNVAVVCTIVMILKTLMVIKPTKAPIPPTTDRIENAIPRRKSGILHKDFRTEVTGFFFGLSKLWNRLSKWLFIFVFFLGLG